MKRPVQISCLLAFSAIYFFTPAAVIAQSKQPAGLKVRSEMLVSTDWLAKHINDPKVFVIHVAADRKISTTATCPARASSRQKRF